jgi:FMNH2-dependent dimethyl sulfone monooxygenase
VFGTVHAPLVHPVFAAKQFSTVDQISEGRFGLNMVAGWNKDEFDMFGREQHEHDRRYDYAQEWVEIIKLLWERPGTFDYEGEFFHLPKLYAEPKPYGGSRPLIMNAGASPRGREFAIQTSDVLFTLLVSLEAGVKTVAAVKAQAAAMNRDIDVYTSSYCVLRPTRREAQDYHRYYVEEQGDGEAFEHLAELQFPNPEQRASLTFGSMRERFIGGNGSYPLIGDPDDIAGELARVSAAGYTGICTSFVNYLDEFPYFRQEVLPRLARLGLREDA